MVNLYTQEMTRTLCLKAGFAEDNAKIAAAIAMCESPYTNQGVANADFGAIGDQDLANDTWGYSYGGFQIRSLRSEKGTGKIRDEDRLLDPLFNAKSARAIKLAAHSFNPWTTFTSGMYKAYMQDVFPPAPGTYIVLAGDTLAGIASKMTRSGYIFTWQELAIVNNLHSPYTIYIGQKLTLPKVSDEPSARSI